MRSRFARFAPVLVFLLGLLTGVALSALWAARRLEKIADNGPAGTARFVINALARRLDLDDAQRAKFEPVFARVEQGFADMHREDMPRVKALIEGAAAEIRPSLTPGQQAEMDELLERPRARWERFAPVTPPSAADAADSAK